MISPKAEAHLVTLTASLNEADATQQPTVTLPVAALRSLLARANRQAEPGVPTKLLGYMCPSDGIKLLKGEFWHVRVSRKVQQGMDHPVYFADHTYEAVE